MKELSEAVLRKFLDAVKDRPDFPAHAGTVAPELTVDQVRVLARKVLEERKGDNYGYAALLIGLCANAAELPATVRSVLETIQAAIGPLPTPGKTAEPKAPAETGAPTDQKPKAAVLP